MTTLEAPPRIQAPDYEPIAVEPRFELGVLEGEGLHLVDASTRAEGAHLVAEDPGQCACLVQLLRQLIAADGRSRKIILIITMGHDEVLAPGHGLDAITVPGKVDEYRCLFIGGPGQLIKTGQDILPGGVRPGQ